MQALIRGARELPLRHISIRVPWNDTNWNGVICKKPAENTSCLILRNIRATRNDLKENELAGQSWENLDESQFPACIGEHGNFMSPFALSRTLSHPYAENSRAHAHLRPTTLRIPAYSAAAVPFSWMLREEANKKVEALDLGYSQDLEDRADKLMGYKTAWVQEKANQLVMLDTFCAAIKPEKSLVFFYAKRTPLVEDTRRVLIGAGWVINIGDWTEYQYADDVEGELRSVLWERPIHHSIRPGFKDGFILPYQAIVEYLDNHLDEDPTEFTAFVPDDQFWSFSYGSEHITNDGAIAALLSLLKALKNINGVIPGNWEQAIKWINNRLNELWAMRGPCPGLGSALSAFGVKNGTLLAMEIESLIAEQNEFRESDPWTIIDRLFRDNEKLNSIIKQQISPTLKETWSAVPEERKKLLKLLSRFELSMAQAERFFVHEAESRQRYNIGIQDRKILENPYSLYEEDRRSFEPINLPIIDRGLFPDANLRDKYPLPEPSNVVDSLDKRRVRAFVIQELEKAAQEGHTLLSRESIIQNIRVLETQPACPITGDSIAVIEDTLAPKVNKTVIDDLAPAFQLAEFTHYGNIIRQSVKKRINGKRHSASIDWESKLTELFGGEAPQDDAEEKAARQEKIDVLKELYASRFSVLLGPAGTGKTTLLRVLCEEPAVSSKGILLLAPTGKARVQMEKQTQISGAKTIAQFLLQHDRFEPTTATYQLSENDPGVNAFKTVIIDESSMLTEDQLAVVIDALKGVERLILVGDDRQLPPIGAGRPFLDIIQYLAPDNRDSIFPRVSKGFAELTINRRQAGRIRNDLKLAEWFSGRPLDPGADEIWTVLQNGVQDGNLEFIEWNHSEELTKKLLDKLIDELGLESLEDSKNFELSCGGKSVGSYVFFNVSKSGENGAAFKAEDWEILSPIRGNSFGVESLNRIIQETFRAQTKKWAQRRFNRKIPKPMGREEILYGDKVIQVQNKRRFKVYPKADALEYVANGEIGIVVGQYKHSRMPFTPYALEIEFSTQPGYKYSYYGNDFGEEGNAILELAYALTIHKTQGSEFGKTFVIIPNPCRLLSRELLYTALTRQREKIIIFHQGSLSEIKDYSNDFHSESVSRLSNLFKIPKPVLVNEKFLEDNLIHRTARGLCVRSKSEVIIATALDTANIDYVYENKLIVEDGSYRYPDFYIEDAESGVIFIWEHLGMLSQPKYRSRWKRKLAWYKAHGVLPIEDGGGTAGSLIISRDQPNGGIDVQEIEKCINLIQSEE